MSQRERRISDRTKQRNKKKTVHTSTTHNAKGRAREKEDYQIEQNKETKRKQYIRYYRQRQRTSQRGRRISDRTKQRNKKKTKN